MKRNPSNSASPEARAAIHEMMAAFEAFKAANEERLAKIEKAPAPHQATSTEDGK